MASFVPFLLFLHVMGAILAFGPTFAYSIIEAMAGREPQHANFSARQTEAIGNKMVYPLAIFQGITGVPDIAWDPGHGQEDPARRDVPGSAHRHHRLHDGRQADVLTGRYHGG